MEQCCAVLPRDHTGPTQRAKPHNLMPRTCHPAAWRRYSVDNCPGAISDCRRIWARPIAV